MVQITESRFSPCGLFGVANGCHLEMSTLSGHQDPAAAGSSRVSASARCTTRERGPDATVNYTWPPSTAIVGRLTHSK